MPSFTDVTSTHGIYGMRFSTDLGQASEIDFAVELLRLSMKTGRPPFYLVYLWQVYLNKFWD
jgi:hypothetical protein